MRHRFLTVIATAVLALVFNTGCNKDSNKFVVMTSQVSVISDNIAFGLGEIVWEEGVEPMGDMGAGFCWGTHPNPDCTDSYAVARMRDGSFSCGITGLEPNTTYYLRSFAVKDSYVTYGTEVSFTTMSHHDYVDLGLPSGTLWATNNVGATTPEGFGDYFAWGETVPKTEYNWSTYKYCNGDYNQLTKYCDYSENGYNGFTDNLTQLQPEDDAAQVILGDEWCMPTDFHWYELLSNTTFKHVYLNGVDGVLFAANNGYGLFLPSAGSLWEHGGEDLYWSSSLAVYSPPCTFAVSLVLYSSMLDYGMNDMVYCCVSARYKGQPVRPIRCVENPRESI